MEQVFRDKIMPAQWLWCIINNLQSFNDKPDFILALIKKYKRIKDHKILSTFANIMNCVETFHTENNKFPDIEWLQLNFKGNMRIVETDDKFSMQIYESIDKYLEQEYLKQEVAEKIVSKDNLAMSEVRDLTRQLSKFADSTDEVSEDTKESLINSYEDYSANFKGLKTHIKPVDNLIGVLGYKSVSVLAAPSGNGKSTFAMSVAYYAAIHGSYVIYLSFEVPKNHVFFNMISMESEGTDTPIKASSIKEGLLNATEKEWYKNHMFNFLGRIKASDGWLDILDQTTASVNTYEGLCAKLEAMAEKRGRAADLIVVDNIDNFQILKSSERDEATKVNNYIVSLDAFSKKYYNGAGTTILLLSQVNRPALKKLNASQNEDGSSRKLRVDVTCFQKYNALYEKATCALVLYSDEVMRASDTMNLYAVKLRNRAVPVDPVKVRTKFAYSKVIGEFPMDSLPAEKKEVATNNFLIEAAMQNESITEDELKALGDELEDI